MELIDVFKQLVKDYPETFKLVDRLNQLDLAACPWNIASLGIRTCDSSFICKVHDFSQNTVNDFDLRESGVMLGAILKYNSLVEIYLTEPQKVYDVIVKSMTAYYELKKQAELKLYNKQVDQTLKVLD